MADETGNVRMTYGGYLRLDDLLRLQDGPSGYSPAPCNDELHFIIVHQTFEMWFKLILRELKEARKVLAQDKVEEAQIPIIVHHLERVSEIFRLLADQWKVMETLSPQDFLAFRDRLGPPLDLSLGKCENSRSSSVLSRLNASAVWTLWPTCRN